MKEKIDIDKIEKKNPFSLPENYFEQFKLNLNEAITREEERAAIKSRGFWNVVKPQLALVSSFALLIVTFYFIFNLTGGAGESEFRSETIASSDTIELITPLLDEDEVVDLEEKSLLEITPDQLIDYLKYNVDLVSLSYLDF